MARLGTLALVVAVVGRVLSDTAAGQRQAVGRRRLAGPFGPRAGCGVGRVLLDPASPAAAPGQTALSDGAQIFQRSCASCHTGAADSRAPSLEALRSRTPQAVIEALVNGAMRPQGSRMSGAERRAVAEFVTGKTIGGTSPARRRDGASPGLAAAGLQPKGHRPRLTCRWGGWSPTITNTRFQDAQQAGLAASDIPRLTLKWAFGFPDASSAWSQPTVAGGRVFVGSQNGTVYSLDAKTGCISVDVQCCRRRAHGDRDRSARRRPRRQRCTSATPPRTPTHWMRRPDASCGCARSMSIRLRASPDRRRSTKGRLYVPVSSYEESQGADPQYACCTFRGSIVALDAATGSRRVEDVHDSGGTEAARHEQRRRDVVGAIRVGRLVCADGRCRASRLVHRNGQHV